VVGEGVESNRVVGCFVVVGGMVVSVEVHQVVNHSELGPVVPQEVVHQLVLHQEGSVPLSSLGPVVEYHVAVVSVGSVLMYLPDTVLSLGDVSVKSGSVTSSSEGLSVTGLVSTPSLEVEVIRVVDDHHDVVDTGHEEVSQ